MEIESTEFQEEKSEILFSIIIPVYGNCNLTKSLVLDLLKLPNDHEIVIVDNASDDDTCLIIEDLLDNRTPDQAHLVFIKNQFNLYHSGGCNTGTKVSRGKYLCYLNNDVRVKTNHATWTQDLMIACQENVLVGPTMGLLNAAHNFVKEVDGYIDSPYAYLSGWCLAGLRTTFDQLKLEHSEGQSYGPWDEVNLPMYFNDGDLSWRARAAKMELKVIPLPLIHLGKMTTKKLNNVSQLYVEGKQAFDLKWMQV